MESKIKRMTETYTSGTEALREFADALQMKASSDMQQMNSMILSQATEVKNVLRPSFFSFYCIGYMCIVIA